MVVKAGVMWEAEQCVVPAAGWGCEVLAAVRSHTDKVHCSTWLSEKFKTFKPSYSSLAASSLLQVSGGLRAHTVSTSSPGCGEPLLVPPQ